MKWIYLSLAIITELIGTSALNSSNGFTKIVPTAITILFYAIAFYFLSLTVKNMPVAIAYAIWSGIGIVAISLIGFFFFKQNLDLPAILGMIIIIIGVLIIYLFSNSTSI